MNRKNINDFLRTVIPFNSQFIGAPRRKITVNEYCISHPKKSEICNYGKRVFTEEAVNLPDFFKGNGFDCHQQYYIADLKNARVWGNNGAVVAAGDYFLTDVSREFNKGLNIDHSIFYTLKQQKNKFIPGKTAVIGTAGANIYYHWMLDVLPRLGLIKKTIALSTLDHFITQFGGLPFQYETLAMLGIGKEKIVASNENHNFHIKAETLYVPSLAGPLDVPTNFQINFLRSLYKKYLKQRNPEKRIYLSRKKVGTRNIVNEAELINALKIYQFEVVECEERSVADQAQLFSEASIIISSHGSALTNLVFCNPGAVVIDIFNESHINPCFWFISQINKLNYHYLCGRPIKIDNNRKNDHTILDMALFNKKMSMLGFPL